MAWGPRKGAEVHPYAHRNCPGTAPNLGPLLGPQLGHVCDSESLRGQRRDSVGTASVGAPRKEGPPGFGGGACWDRRGRRPAGTLRRGMGGGRLSSQPQQSRRGQPSRPRPAGPRGPRRCRTVRRTEGREASSRLDIVRWGVALRRACDLEAGSRPAGGDPVQGGRVRARGWAGGVAAPAWEMGCHPFLLLLRTASHRRGLMVEGE